MKAARNPDTISPPVGRYVHQIEVDGPSKLLFISGQVGMRPDGSVPEDAAELDPARRRAEMDRLLDDHVPTSTLVFVAALAAPQYKVEIDGWAAR